MPNLTSIESSPINFEPISAKGLREIINNAKELLINKKRRKFDQDPRLTKTHAIGQAIIAYKDKIIEKTEKEAIHDKLTGLLNRRGFSERLEREVAIAKRTNSHTTVIFADLIKLKQVNEGPGKHAAGDAYLMAFAEQLMASTRDTDTVARWGGDEFIVLLSYTDMKNAKTFVKRLINSLGDKIPVSIGVCKLDPEHPEESIAQADELQVQAKEESRNSDDKTKAVFAEQ